MTINEKFEDMDEADKHDADVHNPTMGDPTMGKDNPDAMEGDDAESGEHGNMAGGGGAAPAHNPDQSQVDHPPVPPVSKPPGYPETDPDLVFPPDYPREQVGGFASMGLDDDDSEDDDDDSSDDDKDDSDKE